MPRAAASINVFLALFAWGAFATRADQVTICYNYGCYAKAQVAYSDRPAAVFTVEKRLAGKRPDGA